MRERERERAGREHAHGHGGVQAGSSPPVGPERLLALQRSAGNAAVSGLLQRTITLRIRNSVDTAGTDLYTWLGANVDDRKRWFKENIDAALAAKGIPEMGWPEFEGRMGPRAADTPIDVGALSLDQVTAAVRDWAAGMQLQKLAARGSEQSSIGDVDLRERTPFSGQVKSFYEKATVQAQTGLEKGEIDLRHFVMSSWMRSIPSLVADAKLTEGELKQIAAITAAVIGALAPHAGRPVVATGEVGADLNSLVVVLEHLAPNLNAGEGEENSLIGLLSHQLTQLAVELRDRYDLSIDANGLKSLMDQAIAKVGFVGNEEKQQWVAQHNPGALLLAVAKARSGSAGPFTGAQVSAAVDDLAFTLGTDLMKRETGMAKYLQGKVGPKALQEALFPVGNQVYRLIGRAQEGPLSGADLNELFGELLALAEKFKGLPAPQKASHVTSSQATG